MRFVYFTHSLTSCWNHGNASFLRGVLRALLCLGHQVQAYEPSDAWSSQNLRRDHGSAGFVSFFRAYPELRSQLYDRSIDLDRELDGADAVIVHEWNEPWLIAELGAKRRRGGHFCLLFHDTHHRAISNPDSIRDFDLNEFDGVLAFGEALAEVYRSWGWGRQVFVWHEAADTLLFRPPAHEDHRQGLVWIGNWGDGERSRELEEFLLRPAAATGLQLDVHGVRYPPDACRMLARYGARYLGWLANTNVPAAFASHLVTVHVPRRFYLEALPGIPTIRVFEALACGIPLICAPWRDEEHLFRVGQDFLIVSSGDEMQRRFAEIRNDPNLRASLAASGLETILARHTCTHRAEELLEIIRTMKSRDRARAGLATESSLEASAWK